MDGIRLWLREIKLRKNWYNPAFEFSPAVPENSGVLCPGKDFEDLRPRIFLHTKWQDREQEFIDYFKEKREHQ